MQQPDSVCRQCGCALQGVRSACPECGTDRAIDAARRRARKVLRAANVAMFDSCVTAIIGASALLVGIFDRPSAVVGAGIVLSAVIGFKGSAAFRAFKPKAAAICGFGQLLLFTVIATYCGWQLLTPAAPAQTIGDPVGDAVLKDVATMGSTLMKVVWALAICGSGLMQGLMSLYYFTRAHHIRAYLRDTPGWVVKVQRGLAA